MNNLMVIDGIEVRRDAYGRYSLNDLHRAAGGEQKNRPKYWLSNKQTCELIEQLFTEGGIPPLEQNQPVSVINGGNNQGTYVCKELVYAYAMWISPSFHLKVIRTFDMITSAPEKLSGQAADKMQAGVILLDFMRRELNLSNSSVLGACQKLQEAVGLPNLAPRYAIDAPADAPDGSSRPTLSLSALLKQYGIRLTANQAYHQMVKLGIVEQRERYSRTAINNIKKFWSLTAKGCMFGNEAVIRRAGGVECLESWLLREKGCQWPHSDWHSENMTTMRHALGAIRLCWHCDNQLRDQFTERLESMATDNCARWVLSVVRRDLGFDDSHVVTMPELCWWLVRNDLADALPESAARKALRLPKPVVSSVTRESDLVPSVPATSIIQDKAKKVLALKVDPESPESFMLRPKRHRWVNEKYTRWVKTQPCACCGKPADDPHHLIGHGQGGMGTKAHDLFVLPLCRKHHDELHADTVAFEEKYGSQLELIFRFIDRALAIGVLA